MALSPEVDVEEDEAAPPTTEAAFSKKKKAEAGIIEIRKLDQEKKEVQSAANFYQSVVTAFQELIPTSSDVESSEDKLNALPVSAARDTPDTNVAEDKLKSLTARISQSTVNSLTQDLRGSTDGKIDTAKTKPIKLQKVETPKSKPVKIQKLDTLKSADVTPSKSKPIDLEKKLISLTQRVSKLDDRLRETRIDLFCESHHLLLSKWEEVYRNTRDTLRQLELARFKRKIRLISETVQQQVQKREALRFGFVVSNSGLNSISVTLYRLYMETRDPVYRRYSELFDEDRSESKSSSHVWRKALRLRSGIAGPIATSADTWWIYSRRQVYALVSNSYLHSTRRVSSALGGFLGTRSTTMSTLTSSPDTRALVKGTLDMNSDITGRLQELQRSMLLIRLADFFQSKHRSNIHWKQLDFWAPFETSKSSLLSTIEATSELIRRVNDGIIDFGDAAEKPMVAIERIHDSLRLQLVVFDTLFQELFEINLARLKLEESIVRRGMRRPPGLTVSKPLSANPHLFDRWLHDMGSFMHSDSYERVNNVAEDDLFISDPDAPMGEPRGGINQERRLKRNSLRNSRTSKVEEDPFFPRLDIGSQQKIEKPISEKASPPSNKSLLSKQARSSLPPPSYPGRTKPEKRTTPDKPSLSNRSLSSKLARSSLPPPSYPSSPGRTKPGEKIISDKASSSSNKGLSSRPAPSSSKPPSHRDRTRNNISRRVPSSPSGPSSSPSYRGDGVHKHLSDLPDRGRTMNNVSSRVPSSSKSPSHRDHKMNRHKMDNAPRREPSSRSSLQGSEASREDSPTSQKPWFSFLNE